MPAQTATPPTISNEDRKRLETAITAALLLLYLSRRKQALKRLKQTEDALRLTASERQKIERFAVERAHLVQSGIGQHVESATNSVADDASDTDQAAAVAKAHAAIRDYNAHTLIPFLASWAGHQALKDTYDRVQIDGEPASQAQEWEWVQRTDNPDDCMDAAGMGPAPLADLLNVSGGWPPVHSRCQCSLEPV